MKLGNLVRFSSHRRPFLVQETYCDNPDCPCSDVFLRFTEIGEDGAAVAEPLSFEMSVDLETWEEREPPERPQKITRFAAGFLRDFPPEKRSQLQSMYKSRRETNTRIRQYRFKPEEVEQGLLVSYSDIISPDGAVSSGGRTCPYRLEHKGREYLAEDMYCPSPRCDCQEVHLLFMECLTEGEGENCAVTIRRRFLAKVTLDGRFEIEKLHACRQSTAEELLSLWREHYEDDLNMLEERYRQVKQIGRRSQPRRIGKPGSQDVLAPASRSAKRTPTSRNAPCPCGSGKKYKRCCGKVPSK